MRYRLGIDVGTASCALVAMSLDGQNRPVDIIYSSVDIFPEPLLPAKQGGVGEPKKAARRAARQARRQIDRRKRRYRRIAHLFRLVGLDPERIGPDPGQSIHALRAKAAAERIELPDLLRVFLKLAKRRGYAGTFRVRSGDKDMGPVQEGISALKSQMSEFGYATLGQYLAHRHKKGETLKLAKVGLYADRKMVEEEFDRIWETQAGFHPILKETRPDPIDGKPKPLKTLFHDAIFHQRPLKSPAPMVGRCPLEPSLPRAPWAQMVAQEFRIEKQIADLRWGIGRSAQPLSSEQKAVIRDLLNKHKEVSFDRVIKAFEKAGCPGPSGRGLNLASSNRDALKGNTTIQAFKSLGLAEEWQALPQLTQERVINFLADLGSPEQLDRDDWHTQFTKSVEERDPASGRIRITRVQRKFDPGLVDFINKLRVHEKFGRLSAMKFDGGRCSYSLKALKQLVHLMQTEGLDEHYAIQKAYPAYLNTSRSGTQKLSTPPVTGNTVVDVALRQVRRAVRLALDELGAPPTEIIVELSRDMALGIQSRREIEKKIGRNMRRRREAAQHLEEHGVRATDNAILRYLLWTEQDQQYCPYCDRAISFSDAVNENATQKDHILPRSLTRVGRQRTQLVLAHRHCNEEKGARTPFQAFGSDPQRWRIIEDRAEMFRKNKCFTKARLLVLKDWEEEVLDESAISEFTERQFAESSWIAKLTAQWLRDLCPNVMVSRGLLTGHLRRIWRLDTVIPELRYEEDLPVLDTDNELISAQDFNRYRLYWEGQKTSERTARRIDKRIDHRHHLIDALVIGLSDRRLYRQMAEDYKRQRETGAPGAAFRLKAEPPILRIREQAIALAQSCRPRHRPDRRPGGAFFKETAYGRERRPADGRKPRLAVRTQLAELVGQGASVAQARRALEAIESDEIRGIVQNAFEERVAAGMSPAEALRAPIVHPGYGTQIKRVRVLGDSLDTASLITHNGHCKYLVNAGYAYLEVQQDGGRLVASKLVPVREAATSSVVQTADGIMRLFKGDTVRDRDGQLFVVKQFKSEGNGKLILVPVTEALEVAQLQRIGTQLGRSIVRTVQGRSLAALELVN